MLTSTSKIPNVSLATMENGEIISHKTHDLFAGSVCILVGVPGVFTPVCTEDHIPSLIKQSEALKRAGIREIYVVSDDNPWAIDAWCKTMPGSEVLTFLSDGNKDFIKATRMFNSDRQIFVGDSYARFYALIEDNAIKRIRFETSVLNTICTKGDSIIEDLSDYMPIKAVS
jgi:peroxiredoxin